MRQSRVFTTALLVGSAAFVTAAAMRPKLARQSPPSTLAATTPVNLTGPPEPVLYRFLFHSAVAREAAARRREAGGRDGTALRQFLANHAQLNPGESATVLQAAAEETAAEGNDLAQEQKLIADWRAAARQHVLGAGPLPPQPLAQLRALQADRDAIAMRERDQLHTLLGDDGFNRLEVYIHSQLGRARHAVLPVPGAVGGGAQ